MAVNAFLDLLRKQTQELRDEAADWRSLPASLLLRQPSAGSWSVAQCLDHLNGYGDFYFPQLERALAAGSQHNIPEFRSGWLGNYFANSMEPKPDGMPKSKMKAFAKHIPAADLDATAVLEIFLAQQERLLNLIEAARSQNLNRRVVPLSIASWLRLKTGDVFRFLVAHNRRHFAQAKRAFAAVGVVPAHAGMGD